MMSVGALDRISQWGHEGVRHEAGQRYAEKAVIYLGLSPGKVGREAPGEKVSMHDDNDEPLERHDLKMYQALVARSNYLVRHRSDIQYPLKS